MMRTPKFRLHTFRLQGAMEFMMTYGWAILIIVIVLGAFFTLGVFNSSSFSSRARAGGCYVSRPDGPYSTQMVNLAGVCNGAWPEFVARFSSTSSQYMSVPDNPNMHFGTSDFSISFWLETNYTGSSFQGWIGKELSGSNPSHPIGFAIFNDPTIQTVRFRIDDGYTAVADSEPTIIDDGTWHFVAVVFDRTGGTAYMYMDGNEVHTTNIASVTNSISTTNPLVIGGGQTESYSDSKIANVQIYNTSLSSNEIQYLYAKGIGAAPIELQNLVGWWPLNGNVKDYSGNGNDGTAQNSATYLSEWTAGYSVKS